MHRRDFFLATTAAALTAAGRQLHATPAAAASTAPVDGPLDLAGMAAAMGAGRLTARQLTQYYLDRIAQLDRRGARDHSSCS
jgi:hypothetical protein